MSSSDEASNTGGSDHPYMSAAPKVIPNFGTEHEVFIKYLHDNGLLDMHIAGLFFATFPNDFNPEVPYACQRANFFWKIAVSRGADVNASENGVNQYSWGPALMAGMGDLLVAQTRELKAAAAAADAGEEEGVGS